MSNLYNDQSGQEFERGTVQVPGFSKCLPIYCFIPSTSLNNHVVINVHTLLTFSSNLLSIKNAIDQIKECKQALTSEKVTVSLKNLSEKNQTIQNSASQICKKIKSMNEKSSGFEKLKTLLQNLSKTDFQKKLEKIQIKLQNMDSARKTNFFESIFALFEALFTLNNYEEEIFKSVEKNENLKKEYSRILQEIQKFYEEKSIEQIQTKEQSETISAAHFIRECNDLKDRISEQTEIAFICALKTSTFILEILKKTLNFA